MKVKRVLAGFMAAVVVASSGCFSVAYASSAVKDIKFDFWRGPDDNSLNIDITMPGEHVEKLRSAWNSGEPAQWYLKINAPLDYYAVLYGNDYKLTEDEGYEFKLYEPDGSEISASEYECSAAFTDDEDLMFSLTFDEDSDFSLIYPDTYKNKYMMVYNYFGGTNKYQPYFGNLLGTAQFTIRKAVSAVDMEDISDQKYTGAKVTPSISMTNNYSEKWSSGIKDFSHTLYPDTLISNADYSVTYKNNTKPGIATAIITGSGDYFGTREATFKILPPTTSLTVKKASAKKAVLSWKRSAGATGYEIYRSTNGGKFKKLATISSAKTLSKTVTIKAGAKYQYKIRPFTKTSQGTVYGEWSSVVK